MTQKAATDQTAQEVVVTAVMRLVIEGDLDDFDVVTADVAKRLGRLLDYQRQQFANSLFELIEQAENSDEVEVLTKAIRVIGE